jgi:hypothetical protein
MGYAGQHGLTIDRDAGLHSGRLEGGDRIMAGQRHDQSETGVGEQIRPIRR